MYWNRVAKFYNFFIKKSEDAYSKIINYSSDYIKKTDIVLELGAGPGTLSKGLSTLSGKLIVTDGFSNMVKEANKNLKDINNIEIQKEDIEKLSFKDKEFDVVFIANTLHVLDDPIIALEEIKRVLKDEGILIAPNFIKTDSLKGNFFKKILKISGCPMKYYWTRVEYINLLIENDFRIVKEKLIKANVDIEFVVLHKKENKIG